MENLKQELHQMIDDCNDEGLLKEVKEFLLSPDVKEWWNSLTHDEQMFLLQSEAHEQQFKSLTDKHLLQ